MKIHLSKKNLKCIGSAQVNSCFKFLFYSKYIFHLINGVTAKYNYSFKSQSVN